MYMVPRNAEGIAVPAVPPTPGPDSWFWVQGLGFWVSG